MYVYHWKYPQLLPPLAVIMTDNYLVSMVTRAWSGILLTTGINILHCSMPRCIKSVVYIDLCNALMIYCTDSTDEYKSLYNYTSQVSNYISPKLSTISLTQLIMPLLCLYKHNVSLLQKVFNMSHYFTCSFSLVFLYLSLMQLCCHCHKQGNQTAVAAAYFRKLISMVKMIPYISDYG